MSAIARSLPRGIALRPARPGDAAAVRVLVDHLGYGPEPRSLTETFTQVVRHPEAAVLVLAEGVRVVGYLALSHRPQIRLGGRNATIDEVAVDPAYTGRGLGSALLRARRRAGARRRLRPDRGVDQPRPRPLRARVLLQARLCRGRLGAAAPAMSGDRLLRLAPGALPAVGRSPSPGRCTRATCQRPTPTAPGRPSSGPGSSR